VRTKHKALAILINEQVPCTNWFSGRENDIVPNLIMLDYPRVNNCHTWITTRHAEFSLCWTYVYRTHTRRAVVTLHIFEKKCVVSIFIILSKSSLESGRFHKKTVKSLITTNLLCEGFRLLVIVSLWNFIKKLLIFICYGTCSSKIV
jgi:hypothetical protein